MYEFLKEKGGLAVLNDANVEIATREVLANGRSRPQITKDIRRKVRRNCHDFRVDNSRDRLKHILVGHAFWGICLTFLLSEAGNPTYRKCEAGNPRRPTENLPKNVFLSENTWVFFSIFTAFH